MNDFLNLILAFAAGVLLGGMFFGGLWWTVNKVIASNRSAVWLFSSLLLRTGVTLAGFYLFARGGWESLTACLLGFIAARLIVTHLTKPAKNQNFTPQESKNGA